MDFLTGMAYWGILILVIVNAILVAKMEVTISDPQEPEALSEETQTNRNASERAGQ